MHCQCDCCNSPLPSPVEPTHFSHLPAYCHLVLLCIHWTITPCKRQNNGPCPNLQNLWVYYFTRQKGLSKCDYGYRPWVGESTLDFPGGPSLIIQVLKSGKPFTAISSVQFSHSVVSDSLQPHELQHARHPCASPSTEVHSNSHPLSQWCHPAISSSVVPFSSCP